MNTLGPGLSVHFRGCSHFIKLKYIRKLKCIRKETGPGKSVHYKGFSNDQGVHIARFHCIVCHNGGTSGNGVRVSFVKNLLKSTHKESPMF